MDIQAAFFEACDLAVGVVGSEAVAAAWDRPSALDGLTVGAVAAHLYSAIRTFESALSTPEPQDARVAAYTEFYSLNRVGDRSELDDSFQVGIREDAIRRASYGHEALTARFSDLVGRLRITLDGMPPDRLVSVWRIEHGATPLEDYLLTRVVELLVHADDLAVSVGTEIELPEQAAAVAFQVFLGLARARSGDRAVLQAFTRRERGDPDVLRVL